MSNAVCGYGAILRVNSGVGATASTANYTTFAEITNINGPSMSRDSIEVTNQQSPDGWDEHKPGIARGGEITLDVNMILGSSAATEANHHAQVLEPFFNMPTTFAYIPTTLTRRFQVLWVDTSVTAITSSSNDWSFDGFVTGFTPSATFTDKQAATITIKTTGEMLFS